MRTDEFLRHAAREFGNITSRLERVADLIERIEAAGDDDPASVPPGATAQMDQLIAQMKAMLDVAEATIAEEARKDGL